MAHEHREPADSAGQPFAGRHFDASRSAFEGDDGGAPEKLIEALRRFGAGEADQRDVIDAVRDARLLVPLVAHAGDTAVDAHGRTIDKTQELSLVTVTAPDGRTAMPVFTSTEAMAAWNPKARPIPTAARRVALAAAAENTGLLILDPTSPTEFVIRRPGVWAIAQASAWEPPIGDPAVLAAFVDSAAAESVITSVALECGDPSSRLTGSEVVVRLQLAPGLDQVAVTTLLARLHERWSQSEVIATRVDSLAIKLVSAPSLA
ncbi:MAG: hypothetical protein JWQ64_2936 [Subtercola sp.]|nr:hypothetical protein [Subtercola sp.]